jgi:hypothetical protein
VILRKGYMFKSGADVIVFTGNSTVRRDGCLVMGRGAALEVQKRFYDSNREFGRLIYVHNLHNYPDKQVPYGVLIHSTQTDPILAVFQVKHRYSDDALVELIEFSTGNLTALAKTDWNGKRVALNFPGIGYDGLRRENVLPIIQSLPDNVEVWEYE